MLDSLRAFSRTWIAKIFFGVLIVSFAAFGISNVITDLGQNTVARVGDEDITTRDFQREYQAQLNAAAQQLGSIPTNDQALAMGIPGAVLSRLAANAAINQLSLKFGLGVSEDRLAKMLREDPSFAGSLGAFDRANFLRVVQQNGFTETEYFDIQARAARRQQLAAGLFADAAVPKAASELVSRYTGDTRTIDYFVLNAASLPPIADPTDAELTAYLTEHQSDFRTKETRTADILVLSPDALAATKTIAEEAITAEYERTKDSLTKPETRAIQQVVLPDDKAKATFETGKTAGTKFADLVAATGLVPVDLGTLAKKDVTDTALAEAAFGLAVGDFVIIPGASGQRAVTVTAITPSGAPTLAEVHDTIAKNLALAEAKKEITDILDQIEELRAAFQPMADIAKRFNLPMVEVKIGADGAELATVAQIPEEDRAKVTAAIFAATQDKLAPSVSLAANSDLWFDLKAIDPARDRTLDEARDDIVAALTAEKTDAAEQAEVAKITAELASGKPFADVATERTQFPSLSQPLTRQGDGTAVLDRTVAAAAFAGGPNHFGSAKNAEGDYVVFQVVEITPAAGDNAQAVNYLQGATRDTLFSDFVSGIRQEYGVKENTGVINQLLALDANGQ